MEDRFLQADPNPGGGVGVVTSSLVARHQHLLGLFSCSGVERHELDGIFDVEFDEHCLFLGDGKPHISSGAKPKGDSLCPDCVPDCRHPYRLSVHQH